MKKYIFPLVALAGMFSACYSPDNYLFKKSGRWQVTKETLTITVTGVSTPQTATTDSIAVFTFKEDGTGFRRDKNASDSVAITWVYDNDTIKINDNTIVNTFAVISAGRTSEAWRSSSKESNGAATVTTVRDWTLSKISTKK